GLSVMSTKLGNPIMLDSYTSSMCLHSWGLIDYARELINITADRELKEDMVIDIPNVEDDEEVLYTKQHTNHDGFQHPSSTYGTSVGSKFQVTSKTPIWKGISRKNSSSSSGTKKNSEVSRKVMSSTYPFDALNMIEEGGEIGSNGGRQIQMIEGKLMLLDDDGKPLKPSKSTRPVNKDNDSEMEEWMGNISLYEQWKESQGEDPYDDDDFDDPDLLMLK
ncbi:hypothetical protein Tco_1084350, partial [Tanacetum coccineum]